MRRTFIVAFAIVASLLLVTAAPASAQNVSGDLEVASKNTTDTDFQNADLTNLTINGTGEAASVEVGKVTGTTATRPDDNNVISDSDKHGVVIEPQTDLDGVEYEISSNTNGASKVYVTETDGTILKEKSLSGDSGEILLDLSANTKYYLVVDGGGSQYDAGYYDNPSYPYSSNDIIIEDGVTNTNDFDNPYAFKNVTAITLVSTEGVYQANHSVENAVSATANLTLVDANATVTVDEYTGSSWSTLNSTTVTNSANHTLNLPDTTADKLRVTVNLTANDTDATAQLHDEAILFENDAPEVDNSSASPSEDVNQAGQTLSINVTDSQFGTAQGDSVTVEFKAKAPDESSFSSVGSDTISSNGTATTSLTADTGGDWEWKAVATDSYGDFTTSQTFTFSAPGNVAIRDEETLDLITNANATIKFYGTDQIVEREDSDNDGNISMSGLPSNDEFVATVSADNYTTRRVLIGSLYDQQTVYLSPENVSNPVNLTFQLNDQTGRFPPADTKLLIRAGINESGNTTYKTIAGDYFGAANSFPAKLVEDRRYRLVLETRDGSRRELGAFVPSASQEGTIVQLTVESGVIELQEGETYSWQARLEKDSTGGDIIYEFKSNESVDDLEVAVYERGNESNEIYNNTVTSTSDDKRTIPLTKSQANKTWVVDWEATLDGDTIGGERVVGTERFVTNIPLDSKWQHIFSVLGMLVFGGLFGGIRGELGGIALSVAGAVFFYIGWLPPATGGLAIAGGLALSVAWFAGTGVR